MSKRTPIRHGEVLLLPVDEAPKGKTKDVTECIVGHSETGHHHVLESDEVFRQIIASNGDMFVELPDDVPLRHRREFYPHRELLVPSGIYRVLYKHEYNPTSRVMQRHED